MSERVTSSTGCAGCSNGGRSTPGGSTSGALVSEVAALVRVDAASRQVKLDLVVPHDLPPVRGDRVHLQQVLLNLILNGMDALDEARPEDRRVGVTARLNGAQTVEIVVSDAGPGIPADMLDQIFNPFFTTKSHGMGMGLAISRTIIEAHDGQLWAENASTGGAAFLFTLPIADETTHDDQRGGAELARRRTERSQPVSDLCVVRCVASARRGGWRPARRCPTRSS